MKKVREERNPLIWEAVLGLLLVVIVVVALFKLKVGTSTALIGGSAVAALVAYYLGYGWKKIQDAMVEGVSHTIVSNLILLLVGMTVGTWLIGGTVQTLIYYGLKMISPSFFLVITFLLCCITSLATGTSWGTISTVGLAAMGVSLGLGIPPVFTAGAIGSGAFFGDKMSPLSDTTNIASAVTETNIFDHIGSMLYTTGPAAIISIILYQILNMKYVSGTADMAVVNEITSTMAANFNLSVFTLLPAIVVLVLSAMRVPALITMFLSIVTGVINAMITQGATLKAVLKTAYSGYAADTGIKAVDNILSRGGLNSMLDIVSIVIVACALGGILEKSGVLKVIVNSMSKLIKNASGLIVTTLISTYLVLFIANNQAVTLVVSGRTFLPAYRKMGVKSKVLSRTLEDAGTMGSIILPWGTSALFLMKVLNVGPGYIPFVFLSFLSPIVAIVLAYTGFGVWKEEKAAELAE